MNSHMVNGIKMADYHINIFYSEEDGGYIADIPDLQSSAAFGETREQALASTSPIALTRTV